MEVTILPSTDEPYPATNSQPPTTHLALNVCESLHHPSFCEARDVKDEDRQVFWTPGFFSGKQLPAAMCLELKKQKLLSDALDELCLLQGTYTIGLVRREAVPAHCGGRQARDQKAAGGLTTSTW